MKHDKKLSEHEALCKVSEPLLSRFHPHRNFGAISEKMENLVSKYIEADTLYASRSKEGKRALK